MLLKRKLSSLSYAFGMDNMSNVIKRYSASKVMASPHQANVFFCYCTYCLMDSTRIINDGCCTKQCGIWVIMQVLTCLSKWQVRHRLVTITVHFCA